MDIEQRAFARLNSSLNEAANAEHSLSLNCNELLSAEEIRDVTLPEAIAKTSLLRHTRVLSCFVRRDTQ